MIIVKECVMLREEAGERMSIVTFCGHSETGIGEEIRQMFYRTVEQEIQNGADLFYLGGYGYFDRMAAGVVRELKKKYPHIKSILVLAYLNLEVDMEYYDETIYPPLENTPPRYAISKRNEWLAANADTVIAYVIYSRGGAAKTLRYAQRMHKRIINLAVKNILQQKQCELSVSC